MFKRLVSWLLVLCLVFAWVPTPASADETEPSSELTEPVMEVTEPVIEETEPIVEETEPAIEETEPIVEETEPVIEVTEPPVEETEPPVEETEPVIEETEPIVEETEPAIEETEPIPESEGPSEEAETVNSASASGTYGDLTWTLYDYDRLEITGSAAMIEQSSAEGYPWYAYRDEITNVYVAAANIGAHAFEGYPNLYNADLNFCSSLTAIGDYAFAGCARISYIYFSDSLESIGTGAFYGCLNLSYLYFYSDAPTIAADAFTGVIATAQYPSDNSTWTADVLQNYGGDLEWKMEFHTVDSGTYGDLTWELDSSGFLRIYGEAAMADQSSASGYPWYKYRDDITDAMIDAATVGTHAFENYTKLRYVNFHDVAVVIGEYAFSGCTQLDHANFGENLTSIGAGAFSGCRRLYYISFLGDAPAIAADAFTNVFATAQYPSNNPTWTADVLQDYGGDLKWEMEFHAVDSGTCGDADWELYSDGWLEISNGDMAEFSSAAEYPWYEYKDQITHLIVYSSVIGDYAFEDYPKLAIVYFNDDTKIGDYTFAGCTALYYLYFCYEVESIGAGAFSGCSALRDIEFDGNAPSIATDAFTGVTAAVEYPYDNSTWTADLLQNYGGNLTWKTINYLVASGTCGDADWELYSDGSMEIYQGENSRKMEEFSSAAEYPWYEYSNMITDVYTETTNIGAHAFEGYPNLEYANIYNLHNIGDSAFKDCTALYELRTSCSNTIGAQAFSGCSALRNIYFYDYAPRSIASDAFSGVQATAHYDMYDRSWTDTMMQNYGGNLTWKPWGWFYDNGEFRGMYWSVDTDGSLRLEGTDMPNRTSAADYPWYDYADTDEITSVTSVTVEEINVGDYSFDGYPYLEEVYLHNVPAIGSYAFRNCPNLTTIIIDCDNGVEPVIAANAFTGVTAIVSYEGVSTIVGNNYGGNLTWKPYAGKDVYGLTLVNGVWGYYLDGKLQTSYTGLVPYGGNAYYVENGILNWNYTGLVQHNGDWYYVENSTVNFAYTGLAQYDGNWFYVESGMINWDYSGLVFFNDVWYYVGNGMLTWSYTGLVQYGDTWYYIQNSQLVWGYYGLVQYGDTWYYIQNSQLVWGAYTLVLFNGTWYYVQNSQLVWGYYGLVCYEGVWYYVENSMITWTFTDLVLYNDVWYYVRNSSIAWDYTGLVPYYGNLYYVENGAINWGYVGTCEYEGNVYDVVGGLAI